MEITFLGHSSFKIKTKTATLVTDPYNSESVGLIYPKTEADIVTISHEHKDHNDISKIDKAPFIINGAGEYEIKDVLIYGIPAYHDSQEGKERGKITVYTIEAEGLRLCHLGDLGHKLTPKQLEQVNGVDVLFIPVGGVYTIDAKGALEVVSQIEPKIVIPMHYQEKGLNPAIFEKLAPVDDFLKQVGEEVAPVPKLVVTQDKLPEERQIVVLERRG